MIPALEQARLASKALSDSIKIPFDHAREIIAQALEHETWDRYVLKADSSPTDLIDSKLSPDIANNRLGKFSHNLSILLDVDDVIAESLAESINPFSSNKPKAYRIDINDDDGDDAINMKGLMEMAGGDEALLSYVHEMADANPELAMLKNFNNFSDFQDTMRISMPLDPFMFYNCIANITNWELDDASFEEEYTYLQESFHLVSQIDHVSYPVYLLSLSAAPGDSKDTLFESIKDTIASYGGRALILFRSACHKEINEMTFVVIGCFYNGKAWSWTLLTEHDPESQSKLIGVNNFDLETPVLGKVFEMHETQGAPSHVIYHAFTNNQIDPESNHIDIPKSRHVAQGIGGWCTFI